MRPLAVLAVLAFAAASGACGTRLAGASADPAERPPGVVRPAPGEPALPGLEVRPVVRTPEEWRSRLTPEQFRITRQKGTEVAFTGKYWNTHEAGTYRCVACGLPLFSSADKFDSGTGWPSYTRPLDPAYVSLLADGDHGMVRTEVVCARCAAHLGHVFDDGPSGGRRYCINSAALDFEASTGGP